MKDPHLIGLRGSSNHRGEGSSAFSKLSPWGHRTDYTELGFVIGPEIGNWTSWLPADLPQSLQRTVLQTSHSFVWGG